MGVIRGMHFNRNLPQAQLLTLVCGNIFDVVIDIRPNSKTFGSWFGIELSDNGIRQIYMPDGFAHGFCVLSEFADLHYQVTQKYESNNEGGIAWDDQTIGVKWPVACPIISEKDSKNIDFNKFRNSINRFHLLK